MVGGLIDRTVVVPTARLGAVALLLPRLTLLGGGCFCCAFAFLVQQCAEQATLYSATIVGWLPRAPLSSPAGARPFLPSRRLGCRWCCAAAAVVRCVVGRASAVHQHAA